MPRVFDTSNPVEGECGDADLGSPNQRCPGGGGPGIGEDGEPDGSGPNCSPLGNVLIVQEPGADCPDDNVDGGMIVFDFKPKAEYVKNIGLVDVDYATTITIMFTNEEGNMDTKNIAVPQLGDNSFQLLSIDTSHVFQLKISMERSVGVSSLTYCYPPGSPPTTLPPEICTDVNIDFSVSADNAPVSRGDYVSDEWAGLGLLLSASGGLGDVPRIFDTSNPGNNLFGDPDLGSPNALCEGGGPGKGVGGVPGAPGENCIPLGNALIIQEVNDSPAVPDDNVDGGKITFLFPTEAKFVYEMGFLDLDYAATLTVYHRKDEAVIETVISLQLLGDNAAQVQAINIENVQKMVLSLSRSGAVTFLTYCETSPPTSAPTAPPTVSPTSSPTKRPTAVPSAAPSSSPSESPSESVSYDLN